jgi:hypothetical protein
MEAAWIAADAAMAKAIVWSVALGWSATIRRQTIIRHRLKAQYVALTATPGSISAKVQARLTSSIRFLSRCPQFSRGVSAGLR